jgi:uncharacterized protein YaaR (DUF327 family)
MDKVDLPTGNASPFFNPGAYSGIRPETRKTKDKDVRGAKKIKFTELLAGREAEGAKELEAPDISPSEEALQKLLDDVHSAGDALKARPLAEEIKQYKHAVRDFLHYVVKNGFDTKEQASGVNIMKRKVHTIIQVVDQKLEQLASAVLSGQRSQLDLLARLEEINGLLVDLLE